MASGSASSSWPGLVHLGDLIGGFGDSDATFQTYFGDTGKRTGALVGGFLLGLSALVFLWFLTHLQDCLANDRRSSRLANASGTMFAVLLMAASASFLTVPFARAFGEAYDEQSVLQSGEAILPQLGYVLLAVFSMWTAALMIVAASLSARQAGHFPIWLSRIGSRPRDSCSYWDRAWSESSGYRCGCWSSASSGSGKPVAPLSRLGKSTQPGFESCPIRWHTQRDSSTSRAHPRRL